MSVKVNESITWSEMKVDMPGMGPGAEKAGWWVTYLQELAAFGKLNDLANYLRMAEKSGAIHIINIAAEERLKNSVARFKSGLRPAVRKVPTLPHESGQYRIQDLGPRIKKVGPSAEKSEPYYYQAQKAG